MDDFNREVNKIRKRVLIKMLVETVVFIAFVVLGVFLLKIVL